MGDMASIASVPPELAARIKWTDVASFVGQGRNIDLARFVMGDEEFSQMQAQAQEQQVATQVATDVGSAAGTAAVQQGQPQ